MSMNPAAILAKVLPAGKALLALALHAGVDARVAMRAAGGAKGRPTEANAYLRLCAAVSIDPMDGHPDTWRVPGDLDRHLFAMAVKMRRYTLHHNNRQAASAMGVSISTLSRIENADRYSIDSMLAACRYACVHPFQYVHRVSHETQRETDDATRRTAA